MSEIYASPLFGIVLCIFSFEIGPWINRKARSPTCKSAFDCHCNLYCGTSGICNPAESFQQGGQIMFWLRQLRHLHFRFTVSGKCSKNFLPILAGTLTRLPDLNCQRTGFVQIIWFIVYSVHDSKERYHP